MRIHIISNLFAPDELAGAALFTDLALFLKERGHDIRITCSFSYYPSWKLRPEDTGVSLRDESFHGMPVRRVAMYVPECPGGKARILSDLSFLWALVRRARHPGWVPEVVLTALPMLSQCLAQRFLYPAARLPRLIVVQDFVVEAALELGILRLPGCGWALHRIQRWGLRSAQTLLTISPIMLQKLHSIIGPDRRICYVPNWIHNSLQLEIESQALQPTQRQRATLFYSGNLGVKQGLPGFLGLFREARCAEWGWRLTINGGGAERARVEAELAQNPGCVLGPVLKESEYVARLRSATACVVTQRPGVGANFLPSKLLPALATGTPVLAICDSDSPLGHEVIEGGFGEVVPSGDPHSLTRVLKRWQAELSLLHQMGQRRARSRSALSARPHSGNV